MNQRGDLEDDYYQFFSLDSNASQPEINAAYRRLSKFYHPDKHNDPIRKDQATQVFGKVQKIYGILSDPQKRAIYDSLGSKGLEADGWELIEKYKTPDEIKKEFEKINEIENEKKSQLMANPKGNINITLNATDFFTSYHDVYDKEIPSTKSNFIFDFIKSTFRAFDSIELLSMTISQSVESQITSNDSCQLSGSVNASNGLGNGEIATTYRRIHSTDKWSEVETVFGNGLNLNLRHFRSVSNKLFLNGTVTGKFLNNGILIPGISLNISRQLDKNITGQLSWSAGFDSHMAASFIHSTIDSRLITTFQLGIPHCFFSVSYSKRIPDTTLKLKSLIKIGTFGAMVEYGCEKKLSTNTVIGTYMSIGVPFGVSLVLKVNRANQNFSFITLLCQELLPTPIIIGSIAPYVTYAFVKCFVIDPYLARQDKRSLADDKEKFSEKLAEKKQNARIATELMKESYHRIHEIESSRLGLVIVKALYGNLKTLQDYHSFIISNTLKSFSNESNNYTNNRENVLEVTIPLQCLVQDSRLSLPKGSKADLPGFYDVNYGCLKTLYIKYEYRTVMHEIIFNDDQPMRIPQASHKILFEE